MTRSRIYFASFVLGAALVWACSGDTVSSSDDESSPRASSSGKGGKGGKGGSSGKGGSGNSAGSTSKGGTGNGAGSGGSGSPTAGSDPFGGGGFSVDAGPSDGAIPEGGECSAVSQTAENKVAPVDIIWALDTSDSMVNELQQVEQSMNLFADGILQFGLDVHVVVIAKPGKPDGGNVFNPDPGICIGPPLGKGGCPGASNPPFYQHVESSVGSKNALGQIINLYPSYKPTLRQNSVKYFAVVTDDNSDVGADAFIGQVNSLDPGWFNTWKFFGIFCTGGCGTFLACADTGDVYIDLVAKTGGVQGDLCANNQNFLPVFKAMAQAVISNKKIGCDWQIPPPPAGETLDPAKVNVNFTPEGQPTAAVPGVASAAKCDPQKGGWYYDDPTNPSQVIACPATCTAIQAQQNAKIDILFGCDTIRGDIK